MVTFWKKPLTASGLRRIYARERSPTVALRDGIFINPSSAVSSSAYDTSSRVLAALSGWDMPRYGISWLHVPVIACHSDQRVTRSDNYVILNCQYQYMASAPSLEIQLTNICRHLESHTFWREELFWVLEGGWNNDSPSARSRGWKLCSAVLPPVGESAGSSSKPANRDGTAELGVALMRRTPTTPQANARAPVSITVNTIADDAWEALSKSLSYSVPNDNVRIRELCRCRLALTHALQRCVGCMYQSVILSYAPTYRKGLMAWDPGCLFGTPPSPALREFGIDRIGIREPRTSESLTSRQRGRRDKELRSVLIATHGQISAAFVQASSFVKMLVGGTSTEGGKLCFPARAGASTLVPESSSFSSNWVKGGRRAPGRKAHTNTAGVFRDSGGQMAATLPEFNVAQLIALGGRHRGGTRPRF
ncbi:hypothetical protein K488DRAFT_72080 [Vararia minispora EC-137]|uniref:Uncharacterized protein n=1 Tax=Vararia minispora EC-137 TaxID=1314806 RepID=A0ACB8QFF4_9AGAM|nr:hypothetical protein K488DRAFT_72080 [Vararia minispora EC-137]